MEVEFFGGPWDGSRRVIHEGNKVLLYGPMVRDGKIFPQELGRYDLDEDDLDYPIRKMRWSVPAPTDAARGSDTPTPETEQ